MTALFTFNPGKTEVKIPALQIPVNDLRDIFPPKTEAGGIPIVPDPPQLLEMGFDAFIVTTNLLISWLIYLESV
jgi:hypothetical protein